MKSRERRGVVMSLIKGYTSGIEFVTVVIGPRTI